ncbi:MAG: AAA family ATPase, partial [Oligoflexales bacterium]|nr:AAA family ATPase [Oligoflexales bacterium]
MHQEPKIGGSFVNGRYTIIKEIGRGPFGISFQGIDNSEVPGTKVRLKWLGFCKINPNTDIKMITGYYAKLFDSGHPLFLKSGNFQFEDTSGLLITRYIDTDKTSPILFQNYEKPVNPPAIKSFLELFISLTRTVEFFHKKEIPHGNIKASNIFLLNDQKEKILITDFGLRNFFRTENMEETSNIPFIPPEQTGFINQENIFVSDLYSLGILFYFMIAKRSPFSGESNEEIYAQIIHHTPGLLKEENPECPMMLSDIVKKLLIKQQKYRYQTATGLLYDLQKCLEAVSTGEASRSFALGKRDPSRELNYKIPIVGRQNVVSLMQKKILMTAQGKGDVSFISAYSGVGKTRLCQEVIEFAKGKGFLILQEKCNQFETNVPFSAFNRIFLQIDEFFKTISLNSLEIWQDIVVRELGDLGYLLNEHLPFMRKYLPDFKHMTKIMDQKQEQQIVYELLSKLLCNLSASNILGTLIFIDDIQWIDENSAQILQKIVNMSHIGRLSKTHFLTAYRQEEINKEHRLYRFVLKEIKESQRIDLESLNREDTYTLIDLLLDSESASISRCKETAFELTTGRPFYIYEYLNTLLREKVLWEDDFGITRLESERIQDIFISKDISEQIGRRILHLSKEAGMLLSIASVTGSTVDTKVLAWLINKRLESGINLSLYHSLSANTEKFIDELSHNHMIQTEAGFLNFFHDQIRKASFDQCDESMRRDIHRDYAEYLMQNHEITENPDHKIIFEIAFHIQEGSAQTDIIKTRNYLTCAGKLALMLFDYPKA